MKNRVILFLVFLGIGVSPTFAENLLESNPNWPREEREYRPRVDNEKRWTIGGAALGAIVGRAVSDNGVVVLGAAALGAMGGNGIGVGKEERKAALLASKPRENCNWTFVSRTDTKTGQNQAQQELACRDRVHVDVKHAEVTAPGAISYKHDGDQPVDSRAGLSERDRAILEQNDAEEQEVLRLYREQKQKGQGASAPAPAPNSGPTGYTTRVSYSPGACQLYVNGVMNPGC
jgi:hypothetical protein